MIEALSHGGASSVVYCAPRLTLVTYLLLPLLSAASSVVYSPSPFGFTLHNNYVLVEFSSLESGISQLAAELSVVTHKFGDALKVVVVPSGSVTTFTHVTLVEALVTVSFNTALPSAVVSSVDEWDCTSGAATPFGIQTRHDGMGKTIPTNKYVYMYMPRW